MNLLTGQAASAAYITIAILTATTFVFGGFMREQLHLRPAPGRASRPAMMDEDTITVAYREWRGEPRGRGKTRDDLGDCIDCNACVNVCPVGIDIRDGRSSNASPARCASTACDDIMAKVGKPRGLIDYMALTDETHERAGQPTISVWKHVFRLRTIIYTALWSTIGIGLTVLLFVRSDIDMTVAPVRNPQFVVLSDGSIRNTYDVRIRNIDP